MAPYLDACTTSFDQNFATRISNPDNCSDTFTQWWSLPHSITTKQLPRIARCSQDFSKSEGLSTPLERVLSQILVVLIGRHGAELASSASSSFVAVRQRLGNYAPKGGHLLFSPSPSTHGKEPRHIAHGETRRDLIQRDESSTDYSKGRFLSLSKMQLLCGCGLRQFLRRLQQPPQRASAESATTERDLMRQSSAQIGDNPLHGLADTASSKGAPKDSQEHAVQQDSYKLPPARPTITPLRRPTTRQDFQVAVICALPLEADAVVAVFDRCWGDDPQYNKAQGDPNAYSTGTIGRHNVVLAHMPGMGKASAAAVAANCRASFPNIKLAVVVGVCGAVPLTPNGDEILLGDVIICEGIVQYDFGRRLPERFVRKDTLLDSLGRPNPEIRALLAKLKTDSNRKTLQDKTARYLAAIQGKPDLGLAAGCLSRAHDRLFVAAYHHVGSGTCQECGCNGPLVSRKRLEQGSLQPIIHFGLIASGDTVMKSAEDRDAIAQREGIVGFEMEGAGVWDSFPCVVVIKGVCDYADSHKTKVWQRYAAATAAACMRAFLDHWVPSVPLLPGT